jgi:magnesium transporter
MIQQVFFDEADHFEWIDVIKPTQEDYKILAEKFKLHPASLKDCMSPMHLPKYEKIDNTIFMIIRIFDERSNDDADTIQKLTNKIAIFVSHRQMITIHNKEERILNELQEEWKIKYGEPGYTPSHLANQFLSRVINTYDPIIKKISDTLDIYEEKIFVGTKDSKIIMDLYHEKRRASVFKRTLYLTKDVVDKFAKNAAISDPYTHDLIDSTANLFFLADELHENVNNLLNLHLSLASHRSNEVMGVLTMASVFFLPLTFIAGVYGMNFEFMPELKQEWGYPAVWITMMAVIGVIYWWFKRKGWL